MGRHDQATSSRKSNRESDDDRLLRKAREYVAREERTSKEREERTSNSRGRKGNGNDEEDRRKRKHRSKRDDDHGDRRSRKHSRKQCDSASVDDNRKKRSRRDQVDEKRRREKSKKKSKHSSSRDEMSAKSKVDKSKLFSLGGIAGKPPSILLDPNKDYFAFHQHLWVYLYREEGIAFGDLTSDESRKAFQRFCMHYNEGKLETAYYKDVLPLKAVEESKTTRHKWSFQTSTTEVKALSMIEEGVRKQTEYEAVPNVQVPTAVTNPAQVPAIEEHRDEAAAVNDSLQEYRANKRLREHVRTVGEELTGGRKDGRERQLEKKKETAAALHGAARDREGAGLELADSDIYGDSNADFSAALARERRYKEKRNSEKGNRLAELQQKEHERQQAMLNALGLTGIKAGQKITIAPRKDT